MEMVFVINTVPLDEDFFLGRVSCSRKSKAAKIFEKKILTGQVRFDIVPILLQRLGRKKLVFEN